MSDWKINVHCLCQLYGPRNVCFWKMTAFSIQICWLPNFPLGQFLLSDDTAEAYYFLLHLSFSPPFKVCIQITDSWKKSTSFPVPCSITYVCGWILGIFRAWSSKLHVCYCVLNLCEQLPWLHVQIPALNTRPFVFSSIDYTGSQTGRLIQTVQASPVV